MRLKADKSVVSDWVHEEVGGPKIAQRLIQKTLGCSDSKANKIANCCYHFALSPSEQDKLVELMEKPKDRLFPDPFKRGRRAS